MAEKTLAELMGAAAADAVQLTDTFFCEALDFSEASVDTIERLVEKVHFSMPRGKTPENIDMLCRAWGAYIGEVFRLNVGGEWVAWEDRHGKAIAFQSGGVKILPRDKVRKRLGEGPEHDLRDYYRVFRDQMLAGK